MRGSRLVILAALAAAAVAVGLVLTIGDDDSSSAAAAAEPLPGLPSIAFVSPRNGAAQRDLAVVVKVAIENFELAPRQFGGEPRLGQGNIRFSLHRVPDCVDPVKLQRAIESPIGNERLQGASYDFPHYAGPNGILGARLGASGSYSPATRPEIFYDNLKPGFYRLVATLAANDGSPTPYHTVTSFQILEKPHHEIANCTGGKVSSAKAATSFE
jgi:hypothetical protein